MVLPVAVAAVSTTAPALEDADAHRDDRSPIDDLLAVADGGLPDHDAVPRLLVHHDVLNTGHESPLFERMNGLCLVHAHDPGDRDRRALAVAHAQGDRAAEPNAGAPAG